MKKKVKKYAAGGLSGIAESAQSMMGDVDSMADTLKYGKADQRLSQPVGFTALTGAPGTLQMEQVKAFPGSATGVPAGYSAPGPYAPMKKGGQVKAKKASSASKRADGAAQRGKTRGRYI